MKIRQTLLACAAVMALTMSPVWADGDNNNNQGDNDQGSQGGGGSSEHYFKAPEIDASSGKTAIALITGALLLVGERARSRRPAKVDE